MVGALLPVERLLLGATGLIWAGFEVRQGLRRRPEAKSADRIAGVSKAIADALSIRPSQIDVEDPAIDGDALVINKFQMRGRFAMSCPWIRFSMSTSNRRTGLCRRIRHPCFGTA